MNKKPTKPKRLTCPYCGGSVKYCPSSAHIYGKDYGPVYDCRPCDAYVGVHKGTFNPKGRLAKKELRTAKKDAHAAFDPLWASANPVFNNRGQAYSWLQKAMNMTPQDCHIGMFDEEQCAVVIQNVRQLTPTLDLTEFRFRPE
jgi:hypothetical protein